MVLKNVICFFILSKYYMRNNNAIIKCFCKLPWKAVCWKMKKETNGKVFQNVLSWYNYLLLRNQTAQALVLITRSQHMIKLSGAGIWCSFFFENPSVYNLFWLVMKIKTFSYYLSFILMSRISCLTKKKPYKFESMCTRTGRE